LILEHSRLNDVRTDLVRAVVQEFKEDFAEAVDHINALVAE
jgi:hypothetical protein